MDPFKGMIYMRDNPWFKEHNVIKLGVSGNLKARDSTYITGEVIRGEFICVIEIPLKQMNCIDNLLKAEFNDHHKYLHNSPVNGGTEFYDRCIADLIVPYLHSLKIDYKVFSKEEIDSMERRDRFRYKLKNRHLENRMKQIFSSPNLKKTLNKMKKKKRSLNSQQVIVYIPRTDQILIVNNSNIHFQTHHKGILILPCGIGKTLISLWIVQLLQVKTLIVGVPNKLLLKQWGKVIGELFPDIPVLSISAGVNQSDIQQFLEKYKKQCIVITTYSSSHKVYSVTQHSNFRFEMKILDEVHHLTSHNMRLANNAKTYIQMLNIASIKQLSLTATLKNLESMGDENVISNDNVYHFGEIIDRKSLLWAIEQDIICDYVIETLMATEEQSEQCFEQFNITDDNDKRLFLSAYAALKSINDGHSHHLLIYSNKKESSKKLDRYIKLLLENRYFDIPYIYSSNYHGDMNPTTQSDIIKNFENTKHAIITCVYCLGEGWDFPLLDGVVFAENMTSDIRIVQSALRSIRKYLAEPHKKAKIILPILDRDDWLENSDNPDLKKVKEVVYQMGLEDETISLKIKACLIEVKKQKRAPPSSSSTACIDFGEYDDELTQRLRIKTIKRTTLGTTYEKARKIIVGNDIKTPEEYAALCSRDNRLPPEPESRFRGQFTTWMEYLSIQPIDLYDLDTCKSMVRTYLEQYPDIRSHCLDLSSVCHELCKLDQKFPPKGLWVEYYKVNMRDIITIASKKKKLISGII